MPRGKSLILHGAIPALRMSQATGLQEARLVPDDAPPHLRGQPSANAQLFFLAPPPRLPLRPGRLNWQQQNWLEAPGLAHQQCSEQWVRSQYCEEDDRASLQWAWNPVILPSHPHRSSRMCATCSMLCELGTTHCCLRASMSPCEWGHCLFPALVQPKAH